MIYKFIRCLLGTCCALASVSKIRQLNDQNQKGVCEYLNNKFHEIQKYET